MPPHIVILDEDSSFALYLENLLRRHGHAAIAIRPGKGAFRRLAEQNRRAAIQLLITDIFMPEPNGFEVLRFAQEKLPGIPVIGVSGSDRLFLGALRELGAWRVFRKPIDRALFMAEIETLFGRPGQHRSEIAD